MNQVTVTADEFDSAKYEVTRGDDYLGVITDETPAGLARGSWVAWSSKAERRDGIVGFFATKEAAVEEIATLWGIAPEADEDIWALRCQSVRGGATHVAVILDDENGDVFPKCRTGASTNAGTAYRDVHAEMQVTCKVCAEYMRRAAA